MGNARLVDLEHELIDTDPAVGDGEPHEPAGPDGRIDGVIVEDEIAEAVGDRVMAVRLIG